MLTFLYFIAFIIICINIINYTPIESEGDFVMFFSNLMIAMYFGYMSIGKLALNIL